MQVIVKLMPIKKGSQVIKGREVQGALVRKDSSFLFVKVDGMTFPFHWNEVQQLLRRGHKSEDAEWVEVNITRYGNQKARRSV